MNMPSMSRFILALCLCLFSFLPQARADTVDDYNQVIKLLDKGDYGAAEKLASESIKRGPTGLLFSGTIFISTHFSRGVARLMLGNVSGAIEDADVIIKEDSSFIGSAHGYRLRGVAKALTGDANAAAAEFQKAMEAAKTGTGPKTSIWLVLHDRAIAKILLGDLAGADADLSLLLSQDMPSGLLVIDPELRKQSAEHLKSAVAALKANNMAAAREALNRSILPLKSVHSIHEYLLITLVLNNINREETKLITTAKEDLLLKAQQQLSNGHRMEAFKLYVRVFSEANPKKPPPDTQTLANRSGRLQGTVESSDSLGEFESKAIEGIAIIYPTLRPQPGLPEEARRHLIQAASHVAEKRYSQAIELYGEALRIAPWWANAHFNQALLYAELQKFHAANITMKRYLLLAPRSEKAREAQDKLYEWEPMLNPQTHGAARNR
jgi:tetratricopeptide (TPR) repeat protein